MIEEIRIQNLRSIKDSDFLKIRPINILLGANSSGKSTFLRSFPLYSQSVNKNLRGPISWYDPSYVDFGDYNTSINKFVDESEGITFSYKFTDLNYSIGKLLIRSSIVDGLEGYNGSFSFTLRGDAKGTYINEIDFSIKNIKVKLHADERNSQVEVTVNDNQIIIPEKIYFNFDMAHSIFPVLKNGDGNEVLPTHFMGKAVSILKKHCNRRLQNTAKLESIVKLSTLDKNELLKELRQNHGLASLQKVAKKWTKNTPDFNSFYNYYILIKINIILYMINVELMAFYQNSEYIAPFRAEAERFYRIQGLQVQTVDTTGHNLLEFVDSMSPKTKAKYDDYLKELLGITLNVTSYSSMKSLRIKDANGEYSIADVGCGYSQILPVLTKLWEIASPTIYSLSRMRRRHDQLLLIEQPELHLHPAMQAKVADSFVKLMNEADGHSVRLIVETHSQAIINRIGRRIREKKISANDVNVILFEKDDKMQNSKIRQIEFTEEGQLKDWPYGFFDPKD
jgi:predicted ATPase